MEDSRLIEKPFQRKNCEDYIKKKNVCTDTHFVDIWMKYERNDSSKHFSCFSMNLLELIE